ncbi:unnamed protein product [Thelazia callipaeda]|uniref:Uncharacterized protein n=1 Tax=Thelazia callipaeda TaxID=103827 RepID=A0A0N5DAB4_THECL|nr:unnamed protein product [Thelazia callipaeda]
MESELHDSTPQEEVFRSSNRGDLSSDDDTFCDEEERRYRHYCQEPFDRPAGIQEELYSYCIDYENKCPQKTINKSPEETSGSKTNKQSNNNPLKIDMDNKHPGRTAEGFIEQNVPLLENTSDEDLAEQTKEYCERYEANFLYYCVDNDDDDGNNKTGKFCRVYKEDCPDKLKRILLNFPKEMIKTTSESREESQQRKQKKEEEEEEPDEIEKAEIENYCNKYFKNYNYFCVKKQNIPKKGRKHETNLNSAIETYVKPPNPFQKLSKKTNKHEVFKAFMHPEQLIEAAKKNQLKNMCTIDCDWTKDPNCTPECKCDLAYPYVQKFCNPPPMPVFLQTCRIWYSFCPKYKQYHYASQFIHSKSSKGKVNPGQATRNNRQQPQKRDIPIPFTDEFSGRFLRATRKRSPFERSKNNRKKTEGVTLADILKNSMRTPFNIPIPNIPLRHGDDHRMRLPRAYLSDTEADEDIHKFDELTDSGGRVTNQLYSRSPWQKPGTLCLYHNSIFVEYTRVSHKKAESLSPDVPHKGTLLGKSVPNVDAFCNSTTLQLAGLWEANPSNPHNRDHSNKFYYRPDSVTADWLNGQIYWGGHWAVPAASVGGTNGFSAVHFPALGAFFNIEDDYD